MTNASQAHFVTLLMRPISFLCLSLLSTALFYSCADKYQVLRTKYAFKAKDGLPHYNDLDYWAAHPWKWDPSDSISKPLRHEPRDSSVDVFFIHPTTFTSKMDDTKQNARIDDDYINAKTDYSSILYQASVFNEQCRVFAPRYRQAHYANFFAEPSDTITLIFELAYTDIKDAFEYYLQYWNNGRAFIIAGHSQGSKMAIRLVKEYIENTPLQNRMVAAYIIGWPVPKEYFTSLKMCADSLQTGCICSWRTFRKGYIPSYLQHEKEYSYATNPLTWTIDTQYASKKLNRGSVLAKFNKVYKQTADAQISNGFLYVRRPKFPWSFMYKTKNYHIADINLFYLNLRENIKQRITSFRRNN